MSEKDEDSEDEQMKELMENWTREQSSDDSDDDDDDDSVSVSESEGGDDEDDESEAGDDGDDDDGDGDGDDEATNDAPVAAEEAVDETAPGKKKKKKKKKKDKKKKKEKKKKKDKKKEKKKGKKKDKKKKKAKSKKKKKGTTSDDGEQGDVTDDEPETIIEMPPEMKIPDHRDNNSSDEDNEENSEDARMKELLETWDNEDGSDDSLSSDDSDDEDESDDGNKPAAKLDLPDNTVDHIVLAAPDFQEAIREFENMTGIKPQLVGALRGLGTKCARVGLDNNVYIEVIAPDPKNAGPVGAMLSDLEEGTLMPFHFAIRGRDLSDMKDDYVPNELGWEPDHISMFGTNADGSSKKWEMLYMHGHNIGGCVPFYIDWNTSDHPTEKIPEVGALKSLIVRAPDGHKVHTLLKNVPSIEVEIGEPTLEFSFTSPEGIVTFSGDAPPGITFPGFGNDDEDDDEKSGDNLEFPGMPELLPTSAAAKNTDASDDNSDSSSSASEKDESDNDSDKDDDDDDDDDSDNDSD